MPASKIVRYNMSSASIKSAILGMIVFVALHVLFMLNPALSQIKVQDKPEGFLSNLIGAWTVVNDGKCTVQISEIDWADMRLDRQDRHIKRSELTKDNRIVVVLSDDSKIIYRFSDLDHGVFSIISEDPVLTEAPHKEVPFERCNPEKLPNNLVGIWRPGINGPCNTQYSNNKIISEYDSNKVYVKEVENVSILPDGNISIDNGGSISENITVVNQDKFIQNSGAPYYFKIEHYRCIGKVALDPPSKTSKEIDQKYSANQATNISIAMNRIVNGDDQLSMKLSIITDMILRRSSDYQNRYNDCSSISSDAKRAFLGGDQQQKTLARYGTNMCIPRAAVLCRENARSTDYIGPCNSFADVINSVQ